MRAKNIDRANLTTKSGIGERLVPSVLSAGTETDRALASFGYEDSSASKILWIAQYLSPHRGSRFDRQSGQNIRREQPAVCFAPGRDM